MSALEIVPAPPEVIEEVWKRWGGTIVSVGRRYSPRDVEGRMVPGPKALATFCGDEIVSLDSFEPGRGYGTAVLAAAEEAMRRQGVACARLMTSNDNTRALRFYLKRGYRLARVHLDACDEVFRVKPDAPRAGQDGIEIRDLWELRRNLG